VRSPMTTILSRKKKNQKRRSLTDRVMTSECGLSAVRVDCEMLDAPCWSC
jgi:hypothetical protein